MAAPTHKVHAAAAPFSSVLVTGADGFVGGHFGPALARRLMPAATLALGARTEVVDQATGARMPFDLTDPTSVRTVIETVRPDLVVHLAGQAVAVGSHAARATWALNFGGTLALAEAIGDIVPHATMLDVSSSEVYGRAFNRGAAIETTPLEPTSAYARSKAAAEAMVADVLPSTSRLIVARPSNHIGVGQSTAFAVPAFAEQIARIERDGGGVMRIGNLDAERDFMAVEDVVAAYLRLICAAEHLPSRNVFNVASGRSTRIGTLLDRMLALSPVDIAMEVDPDRWRPLDVPRTAIDASRLNAATGWSATHALDDALAAVLDEHRLRA